MFQAASRLTWQKRSLQLGVASCVERIVPSLSLFLIDLWKRMSELYFTITTEGAIADDSKLGGTVATLEYRPAGHKDLEQLCLLQKWGKWDSISRQWCGSWRAGLDMSKILMSHSSHLHPHTFGCGAVNSTPNRIKTSEKSKLPWRHKEIFLLV